MSEVILRPDVKGRINLGELANGVSSYRVSTRENGEINLIPYVEIPYSDKWIFQNKKILEKLKQEVESNNN